MSNSGLLPFTPEQVASWRELDAKLDAQISDLSRQKAMIGKLLEAAAMADLGEIAGESPDSDLDDEVDLQDERAEHGTWTAALRMALDGEETGLTHADAKAKVAQASAELGKRLLLSEKGFYSAINKLYVRSELVKHHGRLFLPEMFNRFQEAVRKGEIQAPTSAEVERRSEFQLAVVAYVADHPEGKASGQIIAHMRKEPEFAAKIDRNPSYPYNVLHTLMKRGELNKTANGLYKPGGRQRTVSR